MRGASIDIGIHNLAIVIEDFNVEDITKIENILPNKRYLPSGLPTPAFAKILEQIYVNGKIIFRDKVDVGKNKKMVDDEVLLNLTNYLESLTILTTCHLFIG